METTLDLDQLTAERLTLVAATLGMSKSSTVSWLLDRLGSSAADLESSNAQPIEDAASPWIPVHTVYRGQRVEAVFNVDTHLLCITSDGPLKGENFVKPSPAARAVIGWIAPDINPHRNGWGFWIVTETGEDLQGRRYG